MEMDEAKNEKYMFYILYIEFVLLRYTLTISKSPSFSITFKTKSNLSISIAQKKSHSENSGLFSSRNF